MVVKDIGKRFVFIVLAVTLIALMVGNVCAEEVNNTNVDTVTSVKSVNVEVNYEYTGDNAMLYLIFIFTPVKIKLNIIKS